METFKCVTPDWEEMYAIAKTASEKIKKSGFYPDLIIAVSRGGLVPARMIADFLQIKNILSVKADHWGITASKDGKARISYGLNADISGKRVLIVDDVTDTGQSMELVKRHIEGLHPKESKTATLFHLTNSKYVPDFFGREQGWAWIVFPWNYTEDMVNIIGKITQDKRKETKEIMRELKKNYDLTMEEKEIEEIMEHLLYLKKVQGS